jgi:hypothetical protein
MMIRTSVLVAVVASLAVGCSRTDTRSAPIERDVAKRPALTATTQADLARELEQAERRGTWREVKERWEGQRLHWTVTRQRVLCSSASACNVAAFPIQRPAQVGWLPGLELSPVEYAKIEAGCGKADQCQLELDFNVRELTVSGDQPTSMRFSEVKVIAAHAS